MSEQRTRRPWHGPGATRRLLAVVASAALVLVTFGAASAATTAAAPTPAAPDSSVEPLAAQTLTWTGNDSTTAYASVTTEATAGPATIVFENSEATGNTTGMQHTLTFDTITEGYNHDVDVDILAYPSDANGGRWEVDVTLTEGTYLFYCTIPGHGSMRGELVVSGGGGGGDDTTPPTVTAGVDGEVDADGNYIGTAEVTLAATDEESGVDVVEYALDGGAWTPYGDPFAVTEVGEHTVDFRATDNAGNVSEPGQESFTVVEGGSGEDVTPPEVSAMIHGDVDADGNYLGNAEVMLSATDSQSGVDTIEYALDGGAWTAYADPFEVTEIGDHTVAYRATDAAGNVSEAGEESFTVVQAPDDDTEAPTASGAVAGDQDADWAYVGAAIVTLSATDEGSGVASIEYALDGDAWTAYDEPLTVDDAGAHTLDYRATDQGGNVSEPGTLSFTVAADAPAPQCEQPDTSPTVVIGTVGTGVRNRLASGNCRVDDLIDDESRWSSHADFVAHVRTVTGGLVEDGILSGAERRAILDAAAVSDVGDR